MRSADPSKNLSQNRLKEDDAAIGLEYSPSLLSLPVSIMEYVALPKNVHLGATSEQGQMRAPSRSAWAAGFRGQRRSRFF